MKISDKAIWRLAFAFACLQSTPLTAWGAKTPSPMTLEQLQAEIQQLRATYETRIQALEKRLATAEQKTTRPIEEKTQQVVPTTDGAGELTRRSAQPDNQFNPGLSLILSGTMGKTRTNQGQPYQLTGFMPPSGTEGYQAIAPTGRGFNLGESELTIKANIDPYFYGQMTVAHAPEGGTEIEEAYIKTMGLDAGWNIKFGRFYSGLGYLNEHHKHTWDFIDSPLAYNAFLGGQRKDDGIQIKWLTPTPFFLELGLEATGGRTFPASNRDKNGNGASTLFMRVGGDLNESHNWRAGLAYFTTHATQRQFEDTDSTQTRLLHDFTGKSRFWNAHFVWKWAPNGNPYDRNFKFQAEYFKRLETGTLTYDSDNITGNQSFSDLNAKQSGWYMQAVYQFMPSWRIGLRTEKLNYGSLTITDPSNFQNLSTHFNPKRSSLMFDYSPTEYSRLRLQWTRDQSMLGITDNQLFLQYMMSLGTHGAHQF